MLAVKTTCKDRWRQILNEADRIPKKHLLTLEPSISENQIQEMNAGQVQLLIPSGLQSAYTANQQQKLLCLKDFLKLVTRQW